MPSLRTILFAAILSGAALGASSCSPSAPRPLLFDSSGRNLLEPAPAVPPAAPPTPVPVETVTVTSGWDGSPVRGARVSMDGIESVTDASGIASLTIPPGTCRPLDVIAAGFLHRRTCATAQVTLWPVSGAAEEAATRAAAFGFRDQLRDQIRFAKDYGIFIDTKMPQPQRTRVRDVWTEAAGIIASASSGLLVIPIAERLYEEGVIVSLADDPPLCNQAQFTWDYRLSRFCFEQTSDYFVIKVAVDPSSIERVDVALRALLYVFALHEHSMPGVMNTTAPPAELSLFERKTLRMMTQRSPQPIQWPDMDMGLASPAR